MTHPTKKLTIVGAGILGALQAYYAHKEAEANGEPLRVTMVDKNTGLGQSTAEGIAPSLTPDEIVSVVPPVNVLLEKLGILFSEPGGIRVDDVPGVNDSKVTNAFIEQLKIHSQDEEGLRHRTEILLQLGKKSMDFWRDFYDQADPELQAILEASNFNPCREPMQDTRTLHDGYRIDLIYGIPGASDKAEGMMRDYQGLGYQACKILSPDEVVAMDPFLADFCDRYSTTNELGEQCWTNDVVALYRPGGCIDATVFLPKFYDYLGKAMGQYANEQGIEKDCFRLKFNRKVTGVEYASDTPEPMIQGLWQNNALKENKHHYDSSEYVFCPGEAVGTLAKLGFEEPAYVGFAGASLKLNIPIPEHLLEAYSKFNHCMEVHREGVVLAWQARAKDGCISIAVAGTKALYADQEPDVDEAFARNRNLLQFNMVNDVLPEFMSLALGRDTKGQSLDENDLRILEERGIAKRWVGRRSVAFDGFPTLGPVYQHGPVGAEGEPKKVGNALTATHGGSGGVAFGHGAVLFSRALGKKSREASDDDVFTQALGAYSSSKRKACLRS